MSHASTTAVAARAHAMTASIGNFGPLGSLLDAIAAYERGDLAELERLRPGELAGFIRAYTEAVKWADQLRAHPRFEIVTDPVLSLFTLRLVGGDDAG